MSAELVPVSAVILAGGRASRFGGVDKGLIELAGRPLASWVAQRIEGQVQEILISANRHPDAYARLGCPVVADTLSDFPGPLAGVLAAGRQASAGWLLAVPCDVPFLPRDLVARLLPAAATSGLARAADAEGAHYTVMLLHRRMLDDIDAYLREGGRKVQGWQSRHVCPDVVFPGKAPAFLNVNTPEDLERAAQLIAGGEARP